jgi:SPP1 gp7 family putative phage head morphogenesis protein
MPTLEDMLLRHQLRVEGVKSAESVQFNKALAKLDTALAKRIARLNVATVGDLTARQYRALEAGITADVRKHVATARNGLWTNLEAFAKADNNLLWDIQTAEKDTRRRKPLDARAWAEVKKRDLGATGGSLDQLLDDYAESVERNLVRGLRQARVNGDSPAGYLQRVRGTPGSNFRDGMLRKFAVQADAVVTTAYQHVTSTVQSYIDRIFYERYRWVAVLDSATTEICRSRDGRTWRYGKGPLPPAHYRCRSKIVPVRPNPPNTRAETFLEWVRRQPKDVQAFAVGTAGALAVRNGTADEASYPQMGSIKPLSLTAFVASLDFITSDD